MSTLEFQENLLGLRQQLYYFALTLTKNKEDAADLLQDCANNRNSIHFIFAFLLIPCLYLPHPYIHVKQMTNLK